MCPSNIVREGFRRRSHQEERVSKVPVPLKKSGSRALRQAGPAELEVVDAAPRAYVLAVSPDDLASQAALCEPPPSGRGERNLLWRRQSVNAPASFQETAQPESRATLAQRSAALCPSGKDPGRAGRLMPPVS